MTEQDTYTLDGLSAIAVSDADARRIQAIITSNRETAEKFLSDTQSTLHAQRSRCHVGKLGELPNGQFEFTISSTDGRIKIARMERDLEKAWAEIKANASGKAAELKPDPKKESTAPAKSAEAPGKREYRPRILDFNDGNSAAEKLMNFQSSFISLHVEFYMWNFIENQMNILVHYAQTLLLTYKDLLIMNSN